MMWVSGKGGAGFSPKVAGAVFEKKREKRALVLNNQKRGEKKKRLQNNKEREQKRNEKFPFKTKKRRKRTGTKQKE